MISTSRCPCIGKPVPGAISSSFHTINAPKRRWAGLPIGSTMKWWRALSHPRSREPSSGFRRCWIMQSRLSSGCPPAHTDTARASGRRQWLPQGQCHTSRSPRSEEHTSELQSHLNLVCRLLLEKKKKQKKQYNNEKKKKKKKKIKNILN